MENNGTRPLSARRLTVNMFWAYGDLSKLERLCISSFLFNRFDVSLWTYGNISNAPKGVTIRDAREIIQESRVFLNKQGSYASFSDMFRYALLNTQGGLYSDTDVIALVTPDHIGESPFLVTERHQNTNNLSINNNFIYNPLPVVGNIIDLAFVTADRFPPDKVSWSELGPRLLSSLVVLQSEHGYQIKNPAFANPVDYWKCPQILLTPHAQIPTDACFLHCYSQMWKWANIDKNADYPEESPMWSFEQKYSGSDNIEQYNLLPRDEPEALLMQDKKLQDVFDKIYRESQWGRSSEPAEIFYSGPGTHNPNISNPYVQANSVFLNFYRIIKGRKANVVDLGCGDFAIGSRLRNLCGGYVACDIVPSLIEYNAQKFSDLNVDFRVLDFTCESPPVCDVIYIREVLQHLSNEYIASALKKISGRCEYLIFTEHLPPGDQFIHNKDKPSGSDIRANYSSGVVLTSAPFNLKVSEDVVLCEVPHQNGGRIRTSLYKNPKL